MSDLIRRQDAIELFEKYSYPIEHDMGSVERGMTLYGIKQVLKEVPSAEPKGIPIEWLEEKLTNHPELPYAVTDGIIEVLELWKTSCGARMVSEDDT